MLACHKSGKSGILHKNPHFTISSSYIPLPDWLARKKVIINPQNDDEECFKWAVIAALKWTDIKSNPERVPNLRKFAENYDWSGLKFPVATKDIVVFETNNNVSVNVLAVEGRHSQKRLAGRS